MDLQEARILGVGMSPAPPCVTALTHHVSHCPCLALLIGSKRRWRVLRPG
jgi:hypothetical protein